MFDPGLLREQRLQREISAVEIARRMGVTPVQVHRLETGQRRLTVDALLEFCAALDLSPGSLFRTNSEVPVTGVINSEFEVQALPAGSQATTSAPPLLPDMSRVAAVRWEPSGRFEPMSDHVVFYQRHEQGVPSLAWGKRCVVIRRNGSRCLGWPIRTLDDALIDAGDGPIETQADVLAAFPVIAVLPPFVLT